MSIFMTGIPEEKEKQKEIGIHAVRGGTIVGEHSVIFAGNDEIIEIKHTATSKYIFAEGSLNAAVFYMINNRACTLWMTLSK